MTAVRYARDRGLRVAAQATGHNAMPLGPLSGTLLIKTTRLPDPARSQALTKR